MAKNKLLTLDTVNDLKELSVSVIEGFYFKDSLSGPEANALLAFIKFVHVLNTEASIKDEEESDTFEIQL